MVKLTDNWLHEQIIRNIHFYVSIANAIAIRKIFLVYLLFALLLKPINGQQLRFCCYDKGISQLCAKFT